MTHTSSMKICFETFNFVAYFTTLICIFCFLGFRFSQFRSLLYVHLNLCFSCGDRIQLYKVMEKQGIVTILGLGSKRTKDASLQRTLSADMSSKKWPAQNGFSPMKKIESSEKFSVSLAYSSSSSSEGEEDYEERKEQVEGRGQFDMWSSISYISKRRQVSKENRRFVVKLKRHSFS
jgi:hypothetical protein